MNLPNKLTLTRILAIPIFVFFAIPLPEWILASDVFRIIRPTLISINDLIINYGNYIAAAIFVLAASTDAIDGYIARKRKLVTKFGKLIDPVADKLLVSAALLASIERGEISSWIAIIIIGRELIVTGLRLVAAGEGIVIAASKWGKAKTITQIIAITALLIRNFPLNLLTDFRLDIYLMLAAVLITIYSGIDYIVKNIKVIRQIGND